MDRIAYLVRRMLLVIPTFIGITIVCFSLTRFLPGGPVEIRMMRLKGLGAQSGETSGSSSASASNVSDEYKKQLEAQFGFDKPVLRQYWDWLVVNRMGMRLPSYDYPDNDHELLTFLQRAAITNEPDFARSRSEMDSP